MNDVQPESGTAYASVAHAFLVPVARLASGAVARVSLSGGRGNILTRAANASCRAPSATSARTRT